VKLYCPLWPQDHRAERAFLANVSGLPIPELVGEGDLEGWSYLLISVVPGLPARNVWPGLGHTDRLDVVERIGVLMRTLHAHPPVAGLETDWDRFLLQRIDDLEQRWPVEEPWRAQIRDRLAAFEPAPIDPVVLGADLTDDHVLLSRIAGRWTITGLIDFGDAMSGDPAYEFVAPLTCFAAGEPALSRRLVGSYGWEATADIAERLTTYCLLHRHWTLAEFQERCPVVDLPGLHASLWG
jgi:hygromycin-B 7''-O-kinase